MKVPMLDIPLLHKPIRQELIETMTDVLDSGMHISGPYVTRFETELAEHCNVANAIGVNSGSDALILTMMAMGIKAGDEVITTPFTFFATAGAITRLGAKCVFVDIDEKTFNIDPSKIVGKITKKTVAIMPVPLFGLSCDMEPILKIAKKYNLWTIEDAAQSLGSMYDGKMVGTMADAGTYSFFPAKNLGCVGDGGAIVTNNTELATKIRALRNHGGHKRYFYESIGGNFRLDALQAAILSVKLPHLKGWEKVRQENANKYNKALLGCKDLEIPFTPINHTPVWNQYTVRIKNGRREEVKAYLEENEIASAIYYPLCLHEQKCFSELGYKLGDFPNSEIAAKEVLSLPIFTTQTDIVIEALTKLL